MKFWYVVRLLYDNQSATRPTKVRCRIQFAEKSQEIGKKAINITMLIISSKFVFEMNFKICAYNLKAQPLLKDKL